MLLWPPPSLECGYLSRFLPPLPAKRVLSITHPPKVAIVILAEIRVRLLVKPPRVHYFPQMWLPKQFVWLALIFCGLGLNAAFADTLQLKGNDAVSGKILIEKPDAVVVDVGYTVLIVPRSAIVNISQASNALNRLTVASTPLLNANAPAQFYNTDGGRAAAAGDVRDLVKQIGEAVVQVRTPQRTGLGIFHQRGRLPDHQFSRHRGRDGNYR